MKPIVRLLVAMLVASGVIAGVPTSASAGYCNMNLNAYKSLDYAEVTFIAGSSDCTTIGVRHLAIPANGGTGYYTPWYYGMPYARTEVYRELASAEKSRTSW